MRRKLISIGLVSLTLKLLITFDSVWARYPGGLWIPFIFFIIVFLLFWLVIKLIKEAIGLIKNRRALEVNNFLPTIFIIVVSFIIMYSPDMEDTLYGKVIFRACYEGTQSQTTFKLRENNRFEIHSTGVFFHNKYFLGQYSQHGDTLNLVYDNSRSEIVGDKVFMDNKDQNLKPIKEAVDSTRKPFTFYYGYCRGEN